MLYPLPPNTLLKVIAIVRPAALILAALLTNPAWALQTSVCDLGPICFAGNACPDDRLEVRFQRSTPIDGLWEGVLLDETVAVYPGRRPGVWFAEGATGMHRFKISPDGAMEYHAPRRVAARLGGAKQWHGQCGEWR